MSESERQGDRVWGREKERVREGERWRQSEEEKGDSECEVSERETLSSRERGVSEGKR